MPQKDNELSGAGEQGVQVVMSPLSSSSGGDSASCQPQATAAPAGLPSSPEREKAPAVVGAGYLSSPGTPSGQSVLDFGELGGSEASDSLPLSQQEACSPSAVAVGAEAPGGCGSFAPATPGASPLPAGPSPRSSSIASAPAGDALPQAEDEGAEEAEEAFQDVIRLARLSVGGEGGAGSKELSFHGPPGSASQSPPVQVTAQLPEHLGRASRGGGAGSDSKSCLAPPPVADFHGGAATPPQQHFGSFFPGSHPLPPPPVHGLEGNAMAGHYPGWDLAAMHGQQYQAQGQQQYNLGWAPYSCSWAVTYYQHGPPPPGFILLPYGAAPPPYGAPGWGAPGYGPSPEQQRSRDGARIFHQPRSEGRWARDSAGSPATPGRSFSRMGRLSGDPAPGKLLGRFRQGLPPPSGGEWTLQSVHGELLDFACEAEVSRTWLQAVALRHAAPAELAEAFRIGLQPWLLMLTTHGCGNYVVQWFLNPGNVGRELLSEVADAVDAAVAGRLVELSRHAFGCRVLQALLKVLEPEARVALALKLCGHAAELASDLHANHVLRVCLETVTPSDSIRPLIEELVAEPLQLCKDCYGCRLLPAVLAYCTIPELKDAVAEAVVAAVSSLIRHQYGNYVVKALYAHGSHTDRAAIVAGVAPQAAELSLNKFASFFVDTLLEAGSAEEREAVARGLLLAPKELLARAMRDESGNYVVRHALERSNGEVREALLAAVLPEVPELWESHYGKHVAQSATQLLGGSGAGQPGKPQ